MNEVFSFVDASQLIAKADLWKERDKAIKEKYEKLNNEVLPKVAYDKEARIGCKGKDKFWYSGIRSPYERVFARQNKRVRYRGVAKNQFSVFMEAICFNLKRLAAIGPPGTILV